MADRTVSVALLARVSGFVNGMRQASKAAGDFGDKITTGAMKNRQSLDDVSNTAGVMGAALVGAAGFAVKSFADFDKAMSAVQAATHGTAEEMDQLREAALVAGAQTKFSATEAAAGIENLAKAGVSTADILDGGLTGALDLAAAGELEVADAAEIAATAMTQFKLSGDQLPHVADLLAAGAGKAQGSVDDMAQALNQSGLVASQFGLSIEETVGSLAAFASEGLTGSDAGTAFKTMLLALANPAEKTRDTMEALGIAAYDAQGNFVGMVGLAQQLKEKLSPLTQELRDQALAQIFGADAIRAASALYGKGAEGVEEWTDKVNDAGYASETAALLLDNLSGDIEGFMGSLETALIGAGEGADGPLRELVQSATETVNSFNELPDATKNALLAIVGGGGLVLLGVAGLAKLVIAVSEVKGSLVDLGVTGTRVGGLLKFAGVAGALLALGQLAAEVSEHFGGLNSSIDDVAKSMEGFAKTGRLSGEVAKFAGEDLGLLEAAIDRLGDPNGLEGFQNWADTFLFPLRGPMDAARISVEKMDASLTELAKSGSGEDAAAIFARITEMAEQQGVSIEKLQELFPEYTASLTTTDGEQKKVAKSAEGVAQGAGEIEEKMSPAAEALQKMEERVIALREQLELLDTTMGVVDAESSYEQAIDDVSEQLAEYKKQAAAGDASTKGMKNALDLGTQAGRDNAAALRELWKRTSDYATETQRVTGNQKAANATLDDGRAKLVSMATQFLGSQAAAEKYVTEVLGIPKNVSTKVNQPGMPAARSNAKGLDSDYGKLPSSVSTNVSAPGLSRTVNSVEAAILGMNRLDGMTATAYVGVSISGANRRLLEGTRARGGPVAARKMYMVGEGGPELFIPEQAGRIVPAGATKQMISSAATMGAPIGGAAAGGAFEGTLYLDSGELMGVVRGEIRASNRSTKQRVTAGSGRRR